MSAAKELPYLNNPITPEDMKKIDKIFSVLEADNQAYDFLEPVDYVGLGILDYPQIIKTPMDLGTVKTKLKDNKYSTFKDFLSDIDLIWTNCKTYNMAGSEIVRMAIHCEKVFKKQMEKQFKNYTGVKERVLKNAIKDEVNENGLNLDQKMNLAEKIRVLSNEGLTQVVNLIKKECPKGIEDIDSEKLQIKIDLLDHKTYLLLLETIENCLKNPTVDNSNTDKK